MSLQNFLDSCSNGTTLHQERFSMDWSLTGVGFGQLYFYKSEDGKLHCESECMGPESVKKILANLVNGAIFDDIAEGQYTGAELTPEKWAEVREKERQEYYAKQENSDAE